MSTTWTVKCKDCGRQVRYSDATRASAIERGQAPPERCAAHRAAHKREIARLGAAYVEIEPGRAVPVGGLKAGRLGRIIRPARTHKNQNRQAEPIGDSEFGIKDEHVRSLLKELEEHRVAVVEAGTGSGKSTFLPWRLLVPPEPYERDHLTRHGQIVVTQPRIDASSDIPEYVAKRLHASTAGPGMDIGYRNSKAIDKTDPANKLIYLTDGTLINMIRRGDLHTISTVVIDEAHERSLNIDLILALLRREMRTLPHLRLIIVSATLKLQTFKDFFEPDYEVAHCPMPSKTSFPVYERFRAEEEIPTTAWARRMPEEVASRAHQVLRWMALGDRPPDIPDTVEAYDGDLLCFLPGKNYISDALKLLTRKLTDDPDLEQFVEQVELLPLYSELSPARRKRPLKPETRPPGVRWRVIMSTNLAETSLTIDGIRHVIDSGLNQLTSWDPQTARADMRPLPHSRAGLLQRRGRAGRNAPGVWHCLFSKDQFNKLQYETKPEIARSPLSAVVLNAAAAGVSSPESLRWLAPGPDPAEVARARAELLALGAITAAGDPTTFGREISASRGDFTDSTLLINSDGAGCAVEVATLLALKAQRASVLRWDYHWPAAAKLHVDAVHETLLDGCTDDLEAACRVVAFWEQQRPGDRDDWCVRHYVNADVVAAVVKARGSLLGGLQSRTKTDELRGLDLRLLPRVRAVLAWSAPNGVYRTDAAEGGYLTLTPVVTPRSDPDITAQMLEGARAVIGPRSRAHRVTPEHVMLLDQSRETRWLSPLADPEVVYQAELCAAVEPSMLRDTGTLLGALLDLPLGPAIEVPAFLPGDRFRAQARAGRVCLLEQVASLPDPTIDTGLSEFDEDYYLPAEDNGENSDLGLDLDSDDDPSPEVFDDLLSFEDGAEIASPHVPDSDELAGSVTLPSARLMDVVPDGQLIVRVVAATGGVLDVVPDRSAAEFAQLLSAHQPGSTFTVLLDEVRTFPHDQKPLLLVRDPATNQQLVLDGAQLGTGLRYKQTRQMTPGTAIKVTMEGHDEGRLLAHLGQTSQLLEVLNAVGGPGRPAVVTQAEIVDASEGSLWVRLAPETPGLREDAPAVVLEVEAGRLPALPVELVVGARVQVRLSWKRRATAFIKVGKLDIEWKQISLGRWELQGDRLNLTAAPTQAEWDIVTGDVNKTTDPVTAALFRREVLYAANRLLLPRVDIIDRDAIVAMAHTGRAAAVVTEASRQGVTVRLPTGGTQYVKSQYLSWDDTTPELVVGDCIEAFVTKAEPDTGDVQVEIRDPAADPLLKLQVDDQYTGVIEREVKGGFIAALNELPLRGFLPARVSARTQLGDSVKLRVTAIKVERNQFDLSCYMYDETLPVPATMNPLWQKSDGKIDSWGLRRVIGDLNAELEIRTNPSPLVRIYAREAMPGDVAASYVRAILGGVLGYVQVPELKTLNADDSELARSFAPDVAMVGRRIPYGGKTISVAVVAARDTWAVQDVAAKLRLAYPRRWVSELFKRTTVAWKEAEAALRLAYPDVWMTYDRIPATFGPPFYRAVLAGDAATVESARILLSSHLSIPGGMWQEDDRIRVLS